MKLEPSIKHESESDNAPSHRNYHHDKMFRLDRNWYEGGLILCISEPIPCKMLTDYGNSIASEIIILEFHQLKYKWPMI